MQVPQAPGEAVDQSSIILECRNVYGQGVVEIIAYLDDGVLLIEQRSRMSSSIIPVVSSQAKERLKLLLENTV